VDIKLNGKTDKSGAYICHTCRTAMLNGKLPAIARVNGLDLAPYTKEFHLTELENNLIALIINFQYIFCLKKIKVGCN